jgi:hypothetical protein
LLDGAFSAPPLGPVNVKAVAAIAIVVTAVVWSFREFVSPVVETVAVNVLAEAFNATNPSIVSAVSPEPAASVLALVQLAVPPADSAPQLHPPAELAASSVGLFRYEGMVMVAVINADVLADPTFVTVTLSAPAPPAVHVPALSDRVRSGPLMATVARAVLFPMSTSEELETVASTAAVVPYVRVGDPLRVMTG